MTELPDLPPPPDFSPSRRPHGLEQAVAAGRRRRGRFLAGVGGASALSVVLIVGLLASTPAGREDSLRVASPAPQPAPSGVPLELPSGEPGPEVLPVEPGAPTPAVPTAVPQPRPSAATSGEPAVPPRSSPAPVSSPKPVAQRPAYVEQTDEDAEGTAFCTPTQFAAGGCAYGGSDNGPVVRRGTPVTADVGGECAGAQNSGEDVYLFDSGQETELVVRQDGREVFRFSLTVRYVQGPHERRLRPGRCIEWRQSWNGVTTAGDPVPAGTYAVELSRTTSAERYDLDGRTFEERPGTTDTHTFDVTIVD